MTGQAINRRLVYASQDSNVEEIKQILADEVDVNVRDDKNWTPLHWASTGNNLDAVRLLLENGADPNAKNEFGYTPLHMACAHGHMQVARLLIEAGADPNTRAQSRTPLHLACSNGRPAIVRLLLSHGADPGAENAKGKTALTEALELGDANPKREEVLEIFREVVPEFCFAVLHTANTSPGLML